MKGAEDNGSCVTWTRPLETNKQQKLVVMQCQCMQKHAMPTFFLTIGLASAVSMVQQLEMENWLACLCPKKSSHQHL